jgi:hypothetical protein
MFEHELYRKKKESSIKATKKKLQLPQLPLHTNKNNVATRTISMLQSESTTTTVNISDKINSSTSYYCNRGIGVQLYTWLVAVWLYRVYFDSLPSFRLAIKCFI